MKPAAAQKRFDVRRVEELIPYARNSRTHTDEQVGQIAAAIVEFGFTNPVLADGTGIIAGHGRVMAAQRLYAAGRTLKFPDGEEIPKGFVPVLDCSGWSEAKRRAYIIADNKLALNAGWDNELLKVELDDLETDGFDLALIGFSDEELAALEGDHEELTPPNDEGRSGVSQEYLAIGDEKVPMTEDEAKEMRALFASYVETNGLAYGFAGWLAEGRRAAS